MEKVLKKNITTIDEDVTNFDYDALEEEKTEEQKNVLPSRHTPIVIEESLTNLKLVYAGRIQSILTNIICFGPNQEIKPRQILSFNAAVCLENKTKLGRIEEIIGLVKQPLY